MDDRRYLIVGGAGYFGARLAEALMAEAKVTITQRSISPVRSTWIKRTGLQAIAFDSAKCSQLPDVGSFDSIINLAMPGAAEAARDPEAGRTRALTTANACLRLLNEGRAARMVHFSTFHVYGGANRNRYEENDVPAPVLSYGHLHLEIEDMVLGHEQVVAVRPSNMVGAPAHSDLGDQVKLLFLDLCRQAASGAMKLDNDGLSYRDFLPFDDAIAAVRLLLTTKMGEHRLFNLARGETVRLDAAAQLIRQVAGDAPAIEFGTGQDAFRRPFTVSIERLKKLGWEPRASLSDEAARIVKFFQEHA